MFVLVQKIFTQNWEGPYGVCGSRQGGPLDRSPAVAAVVPQDNLSRVSTPHHKVGMEPGKSHGHDGRLRKEESHVNKKIKSKSRNIRAGRRTGGGGSTLGDRAGADQGPVETEEEVMVGQSLGL